jgi:hypothetical protein
MVGVVLVQLQVLGHGDQRFDRHPRPVVVAALRGGLARLEQDQQRLDGAQARHVHEAVLVL